MDKYLEKGFSVYTSLDADLSTIAYDELKNAILVNQAESGSAAILSLEDKSILALVNYPSFDPNNIKNITTENLKSLATSFIYEPGSVMKQFSAAFALDKGIAAPGSPVFYCSGAVTIADHDFTCDAAHGRVDLSTIIQKSCNVGMVQLADSFKKIEFYSFLSKFGFGRPVSIPLSDSETGILRPFEKWSGLSKYMISIGQEIGVTTAQLLTAASIIGNEGVYHAPQLVIKIENSQKSNVYIPDNTTYQVITKDTSEKLLKMMTTVVSENGTALSAKIEGISIAGKTGTGQIARKDGTGYYSDLFNSVFMGYIPSENPRFVVVIAIHKPKGDKHTGGLVAAPTFAGIVRRMIVSTSYFSK
jgi:cell division protein FtsI/penicillin-binding protein 2